jgi:hypothetical protein
VESNHGQSGIWCTYPESNRLISAHIGWSRTIPTLYGSAPALPSVLPIHYRHKVGGPDRDRTCQCHGASVVSPHCDLGPKFGAGYRTRTDLLRLAASGTTSIPIPRGAPCKTRTCLIGFVAQCPHPEDGANGACGRIRTGVTGLEAQGTTAIPRALKMAGALRFELRNPVLETSGLAVKPTPLY